MIRGLWMLSFVTIVGVSALSFAPQAFADGVDTDSSATSEARARLAPAGTSAAPKFEKASAEQQSIATGHFARARSLLIAALNEFDSGVRKADPSSLIDTGMFREGIKSRARELERILDPQAKESESGVKFSADSRLLKRK